MLDLFRNNSKLSEDKLHPKFKLLRDNLLFSEQKKILLNWTEGLKDRDNKMIDEFQQTFHSSFWEFYLFAVFREANFKLNQNHYRPDFIIENPSEFYVEAVVSNIKFDGRKENTREMNDVLDTIQPPILQKNFNYMLDEAIVRYSNSLKVKNEKIIKDYYKDIHIKVDKPFIIALGSYSQINYGGEYIYPMMALLYGKYYNPYLDKYDDKKSIYKPGTTTEISLGIFNDPKFKNISAIIFSCTTTLGKLESLASSKKFNQYQPIYNIRRDFNDKIIPYKLQEVSSNSPELLSDGLFIFHNPNAKIKLNLEIFECTNATQFFLTPHGFKCTTNTFPIVKRINISRPLKQGIDIFLSGCLMAYNKM